MDLSQNFVKKMHVEADEYYKYPGASHCDELPYLFKTGDDTKINSPALDSQEFKVIKKMVETFTSFAATGNPNNNQIKETWEEVQNVNSPFKCLNISNDGENMIALPEGERLETWNKIFKKENVDLY